MLYGNQTRIAIVLLAALAVPACGSETPSTPTAPTGFGYSTMSGPPIAAHSSACWEVNNAKAGAVSADVTPRALHLTLGAGTCGAPAQMLAETDGELVNVNAPAGWIHVTVFNRSDVNAPYTLRIGYFH
jgi:hypothetical protein